ncbi:MAG: hypothetical protein ACRC67_12090 [Inquilinus sp.]|uniref:hypothetical protein n=1 Tax=Inquilinus sp. TaxID=1932117 RepID=UPI003F318EBB
MADSKTAEQAASQPQRRRYSEEYFKNIIRDEVERQFSKEQQLLKDSVFLSAKIIGFSIIIFLGIFAVFGVSTWNDIKKQVSDIITQQTELLIRNEDESTNLKDTLTSLLNKSIVSSYLISKEKSIDLNFSDWKRLQDWIKRKELPLQDFSDTLSVLNRQSEERRKAIANQILSEMLSPNWESPYIWIKKQPEKTTSIIENFHHHDLGLSAIEIIESNSTSQQNRLLAADYVRDVKFVDGFDRIFADYQKLPWGVMKRKLLITCTSLKPDDARIGNELEKILSDEPSFGNVQTIVSALEILNRLSTRSELYGIDRRFVELKGAMLRYAVKNGLRFYVLFLGDLDHPIPMANSDDEWNAHFRIGTLGFDDSGLPEPLDVLFEISDFKQFKEYWDLLSLTASSEDSEFSDVKQLLLTTSSFISQSPANNLSAYGLILDADPDAVAITLENKQTIPVKVSDMRNPYIVSNGNRGFESFRIKWIDKNGDSKFRIIVGLLGNDIEFSLKILHNYLDNENRSKI